TGQVEAHPRGAPSPTHDDHGRPECDCDADEDGPRPNPVEEPPARETKQAAEEGGPEVQEPVRLGIEVKRLTDRLGEEAEPLGAPRGGGDHGRGGDADVDPAPPRAAGTDGCRKSIDADIY